jgi:glycosyltransferase involved in cell wall biosynthesis
VLGVGWQPDQPGGLNRYVRDLLVALERAGASPRALVVGPAADAPPFVDVVSSHDVALRRRLRAYARVASERAPDADVIDAHFALYAVVPLLLRRFRGRPLVVHFHGPWADESAATGSGRVASSLQRRIERAVYRRADRLVTLSNAFKRLLVERYGVAPWDVEVIPPGVDLEHFSPGDRRAARAALGLPPDAWVVATVRRLVPRMGIDALLDAWRLLDAPGVLAVAGDGPSRPALEAAAGTGVRFLGGVDEEELVELYRAADVTVVPSLALEGFGLAALESLACGTPVLVTDVGGLPEAVHGLDVAVPAGDARALAARLSSTLPSQAECRARAERFSWNDAVTKTLSVYRRPMRDSRIRVVYVNHTAALSGGELALLRLLPALAAEVEAHVVLAAEGPLVRRLADAGVSVEVLPLREDVRSLPRDALGPAAVPASAVYALRLARRLRALRPDLVHTNSLKAALYGGVAGRLARVPVVWHARDRIAPDYLPGRAARIVRAAARTLPAAVIANSRATLETLGELSCEAVVIPSPVAPIAPNGDRNGPFVAGMVGRIAPWKGQHVFLDAFARAFPAGDERAVLVGAPLFAEDAYFAELRASAAALEDRVEFAGFRTDVGAELAHVDALVHASVVPEPFGQVVVEGMAAGLPVVAPRAGGPLELVEDGVDGLLYEPGDAVALAEHLRRLAADANLRRRLGEAGRKKSQRFAPEAIAREVVGVYRTVLS